MKQGSSLFSLLAVGRSVDLFQGNGMQPEGF